jgi:shikimate dehydrogenase
MVTIRLGLIGDNIAASRSPELHRAAGRMCGLDVQYNLLVPKTSGRDFDAVFDQARDDGYRGLNITYPYKERVVGRVEVRDPGIRGIAACNTVLFEKRGPTGANTDYTGFIRAFRATFGPSSPGIVAIAGCGGVGKAISFALADLGTKALRLFDQNQSKAKSLRDLVTAIHPHFDVVVAETIEDASDGADGLVNATPLGMVGLGDNAFPMSALHGSSWAFDAVYTPVDTPFLKSACAAGVAAMSGFELYFYQGVDAFRLFTHCDVDPAALRAAILKTSQSFT